MSKLVPPLRLPPGWAEYTRESQKLCIPPESADVLDETMLDYVALGCRNDAGMLLGKPLFDHVEEWLRQEKRPTLFLLGEYGDGKTCFTYNLAKRLMKGWIDNRQQGWLPLRLTLKNYPENKGDFLRLRLAEIDTTLGGWHNQDKLGKLAKRLVILDGFDEMSVNIGPEAVETNIRDLRACVEKFEGCKILITSRPHFFTNLKDKERLLSRLGDPVVYQLAAIGRNAALQSLESYLTRIKGADAAREQIAQIARLNDPIGLASKPLFLEMLKVVLSESTVLRDINIYDLYERYINLSLERKDKFLDDIDGNSAKREIIPNMRKILGELAEELQRSRQNYVSLSGSRTAHDMEFATRLWELSGPVDEEVKKHAHAVVGARSLLGRVVGVDQHVEWPVDFCHRSMREYFVAIRLCEAVDDDLEKGVKFLTEVPLNHEILQFASERWKKAGSVAATAQLLRIVALTEQVKSPRGFGGYAITLLYRLNSTLRLVANWKNKVLDGADLEDADLSGLDFSGSSFVAANLANVNFENANFENCDLTGVRLEETKPVVALATGALGEDIIALYGDGVLREWKVKAGSSKTPSRILGAFSAAPDTLIGVHETGQVWLRRPREWAFLCQNGESWQQQGCFPIKDAYECIHASGGRLAFANRLGDERLELTLVELASNRIIATKQVERALWCAALGDEAFIWSDSSVGFRIARTCGADPLALDCILDMALEPTCLDVLCCASREYLVATGTGDGRIYAWKVKITDGGVSSQRLLEVGAHQATVTSIVFTSSAQVASGSADRSIALTGLVGAGNLAGTNQGILQLKVLCHGMRIEGVKGQDEYVLLKDYVAQREDEGGH